ncbi:IGR protein motif-domain-containing protein [Chlamydoabsidia padenii]|nr:IGR protein motif-domain-containing protein [Chlamydoabsidia padenii]
MLSPLRQAARLIHTETITSIPAPRGDVKEVGDFLKKIGRGCEEFSGKFETWDSLFTTNSRVMKTDMGIPTKQRKYILSWLEQYKKGEELKSIGLPKKK